MTSAVLVNLDGKINSIAADTAATKLNQQEHERILQLNLKDVYDKQKEKSLGGAMATRRGPIPASERENMMMDVDEPPDIKGKNRKYVTSVYSLTSLKFSMNEGHHKRQHQSLLESETNSEIPFILLCSNFFLCKLYHFFRQKPVFPGPLDIKLSRLSRWSPIDKTTVGVHAVYLSSEDTDGSCLIY